MIKRACILSVGVLGLGLGLWWWHFDSGGEEAVRTGTVRESLETTVVAPLVEGGAEAETSPADEPEIGSGRVPEALPEALPEAAVSDRGGEAAEPAATTFSRYRRADQPAIYEGEVLDEEVSATDTRGLYDRVRLIRSDTFHYPFLRVEDRIFLNEEAERIEVVHQEATVADHVLVRRDASVSSEAFLARAEAAGFPLERKMRAEGLYRLTIPAERVEDLPESLATLGRWTDELAYAEADPIVFLQDDPVEPNDPAYLEGLLWGLNNTGQNGGTAGKDLNALEGWAVRTDASNVVIGVVDSGVQYDHEDLQGAMWVNPDTTAPASLTHGYDALTGGVQAPLDQNRHGTHVAGTIGAVGNNNQGVVGVAWDTQIMALKFVGSGSGGTISDAVDAIDFGIDNGATVLNNSWGGGSFTQTLYDAVERAYQADVVFMAAAGNDNSQSILYPAAFPLPNVVAVASYDRNGQRSVFSNYNVSLVHVAAPGDGIYSTSIDPGDLSIKNRYENLSGTSMATPQVAGMMALMRAQFPSETSLQLINRLLAGADSSIMGSEVIAGAADLGASLTGDPAGPMNDDFAAARDLGSRSITTLGNVSLATAETGEPDHGGIPADQSVWFKWESRFDRAVDVRVAFSDFAPAVSVYTGEALGDLVEVASATTDPGGEADAALSFDGEADHVYYLAVDTADGAEGAFRLTVESTPDNDRFENAEEWTGTGAVFQTNNFGANKVVGEGRHGGFFGGASLWYQYTPAMDGRLSVRNGNGSPVDLGISIYSGTTLADLVERDGVASTTEERERALGYLEAGETYFIAVDTPNGIEREFFIEWSFTSNAIALTHTELTVTDTGGPLEVAVERLSGLATPPAGSVDWFTTAGDPGAVPGVDFEAGSGTLTWAENETGEQVLTVTILENPGLRGEREFYVRLHQPGGGAYFPPGKDRLRVTIEDGVDPFSGLPGKDTLFYFAEAGVEGYARDGQVWLGIRRLGNLSQTETVTVEFADGTATAGVDFVGDSLGVTFAEGETLRWVALPLLPGAEAGTLTAVLSHPSRGDSVVSTEQGDLTVEILPGGGLLYDPLRRLSDTALSPEDRFSFEADLEGVDMSDNGRFVVFATTTEMTGEVDPDSYRQVYLYDAVKEETLLLSRGPDGLPGNGDSLQPTISGNGRYVVFETVATNILVEDPNGPIRDIVLLDRLRGSREAVNVNSFGELAQIEYLNLDEPVYIDSYDARISKDATAVAFRSTAQNLEVNHPNEWWDDKLYVRDLAEGTTEIVSVGNDWFHPRGISRPGSLSRDGNLVAFTFSGPLTQEFTGLVDQVYVRDRAAATTTLVSRMPDGGLNLNTGSMDSVVLSGDGQKVFFRSFKYGFAGEENNQSSSLYRYDRNTDTMIQVDTGAAGEVPEGGIANVPGVVAVSEDGGRVAFVSGARNFYPGHVANSTNVFLKDLETGAIAPVSTRADGSLTGGSALGVAMDRGGDSLVFLSNKTGLVDDAVTGWHLYGASIGSLTEQAVVSFTAEALTVTRSEGGGQSVEIGLRRMVNLDDTVEVTVSTVDGTAVSGVDYEGKTETVVFGPGESSKSLEVSLLVPPDPSVTTVFSVSMEAGSGTPRLAAPENVEVTLDGVPEALSPQVISARDGVMADRESRPVTMTRDGQRVAFGSTAANLSSVDGSTQAKIFLRDLGAATLSLLAKEDATTPGDGSSYRPVLSPEGDWVAFHSQAKNLVSPTIGDSRVHLFLENLSTGEIVLLSQNAQGDPGNARTTWWDESGTFTRGFQEVRVPGIAVSENADWVAFQSRATNLVSETTTDVWDIYLWERATGNLSRITGGEGGDSRQPVITPDGRYVAFVSDKPDLVAGETHSNGLADVFRYDRVTGETIKINHGVSGGEADGRSYSVAISADGNVVAFDSLASNLVADDTNGTGDVFVHTVSAGTTERVSESSEGGQAISWQFSDTLPDAGHSLQPSLSDDGRYVTFHSNALGLVDGVTMPETAFGSSTMTMPTLKLYVHDRQTGETASVIPVETRADGFEAQISGNGQFIAFLSTDEGMLDTGTGTRRMVYRFSNPLNEGAPVDGFAAWRQTYLGDVEDPDLSGPLADANGDGIPNLFRYLWNQDPLAVDAPPLYEASVVEEGGQSFVSFRLWVDPEVADVAWGVAVSEDLEVWSELAETEYEVTDLGAANGLNQLEFRPQAPLNAHAIQFYRLFIRLN